VRITARCRFGIANDRENISDYAGSGIAMLTLIESTVRATITHSDSEPKASVAATASFSLDEATGAQRPSKPKAPGDRVMVKILQGEANHPRNTPDSAGAAGNIAAGAGRKTAKRRRKVRLPVSP
jgi:hypothetical protein